MVNKSTKTYSKKSKKTRRMIASGVEHDDTRSRSHLPHVMILDITSINDEGDLIAVPHDAKDPKPRKVPPHILVLPADREGLAPAVGDRILAKLIRTSNHHYNAQIMRILPKADKTAKLIGRISLTVHGGLVTSVSRKDRNSYFVHKEHLNDAEDGELVEVQTLHSTRSMGDKPAKVIARLGSIDAPRAFSLIAIHQHDIPVDFSLEALAQAESAPAPTPDGRHDLRTIPLITIDGADARDFDDAVFAEPDGDAKNKGGWKIIVAIADVAHYVRSGDALDKEASLRGNSTYFPDRVVPMLPEALSNGLCSLNPHEDRYCLAAHITIDVHGDTIRAHFTRSIMRSHARRTYENVQEEIDTGNPSEILKNLYGAYETLCRHIHARGPLDLNLPEFKTKINDAGKVAEIVKVKRLDSHRLIEAFMIAANVAAADALTRAGIPAMYRVHDAPDLAKLESLKEMLKASNYKFASNGRLQAKMFNALLRQAEERDEAQAIHTAVLRSQMQAIYSPKNEGHFGLSLTSYGHFTSPIRRYSDLIVHRALITLHQFGDDGITPAEASRMDAIAEHISTTERRSMLAERDANDRYITAFMAERMGAQFDAHISSVMQAGVFITLDENGADGFVPREALADDFFVFDSKAMQLFGRKTRKTFRMGQALRVRLDFADTTTGSLRFAAADTPERKGRIYGGRPTFKGGKPHRGKR